MGGPSFVFPPPTPQVNLPVFTFSIYNHKPFIPYFIIGGQPYPPASDMRSLLVRFTISNMGGQFFDSRMVV